MTPRTRALARARTYGFVAEVLLDGWTERALAVASSLPWGRVIPLDPDRRAARHHQVLGRAVPPYESAFRSSDGLLGGPIVDEIRRIYDAFGFRVRRTDVEPDHAGVQCAALSSLCAAEAEGRGDVATLAAAQEAFVTQHLGQWASLLRAAVARQGVEEITQITDLLADLVEDHAAAPPAPVPAEDVLADPDNGLKAVAAYLLTPARCGAWLGVDDLQRVAGAAGLACGFGRRARMMESLWASAVDHGRLPALVDALLTEIDPRGSEDARLRATRAALVKIAAAGAQIHQGLGPHAL